MKLRQAEALGMFDDHDGGVGNVDPNLNHGGRDQYLNFSLLKQAHDLLFQVGLHASVQNGDLKIGEDFLAQFAVHLHRSFEFQLFVFFDDGIDNVTLVSGCDLLTDELPDFVGALVADAACEDGCSARRHFVEDADVEVSVKSEGEGARDGSSGHDKDIGFGDCGASLDRTHSTLSPCSIAQGKLRGGARSHVGGGGIGGCIASLLH